MAGNISSREFCAQSRCRCETTRKIGSFKSHLIGARDSQNFGLAFSNVAHFQTCSKVWLTSEDGVCKAKYNGRSCIRRGSHNKRQQILRNWSSNLRSTTREYVHLVTRGHLQSSGKDGGQTIRYAIAETPLYMQTSWLYVL